MFAKQGATLDSVVLDVYLGFEIRCEAGGIHVAEARFRGGEETILEAATLPSIRKLIWQWWHFVK